MRPDEVSPRFLRRFVPLLANFLKVFRSYGDVADLVGKDSFKDTDTPRIALRPHALERGRGDIETPRFQHHRDDRQPRRGIVGGVLRRLPQPVMRRQSAVIRAQRGELAVEQGEMHRLVGRDAQEIGNKVLAHFATESPGHVERQIDRDKLDMRQRVPQGDSPALRSALSTPGHLRRGQQLQLLGPLGALGHRSRPGFGQIER